MQLGKVEVLAKAGVLRRHFRPDVSRQVELRLQRTGPLLTIDLCIPLCRSRPFAYQHNIP